MSSNFVYDNGSVPGTKSDNPKTLAEQASVPATQKLVAAELNQITTAIKDLRTALVDGTLFYNIRRYGVVGDNATDDSSAIQAAYDACNAAGGGILYVPAPPGVAYRMEKPLRCHGGNPVWIKGDGRDRLTLRSSGFAGPVLWAGPDTPGMPMTTSGLAGGGQAFDFRTTSDVYKIDLKWILGSDINGYAGFCWQTVYKRNAGSFIATLVSDRTVFLPSDGQLVNCEVTVNGADGVVSASLRVGGSLKSLTTTGIVTDPTKFYHIALTYDGSNVRLFAAEIGTSSTVRDTEAATGTVTQGSAEDMYIGASPLFNDPKGIIEWFQLDNAAIYTGTFTAPSTKPASGGANTRILNTANLNTDSNRLIGFGTAAGHTGPHFVPIERSAFDDGVVVFMSDIHVSGGVLATNAPGFEMHNVQVSGGRTAVFLDNNSFEAKIVGLRTNGATRWHLRTRNAIGVCTIEDVVTTGTLDYSFWLKNFSGHVGNVYTGADKIPFVLDGTGQQGGSANIDDLIITNEGHGLSPRCMAAFIEPYGVEVHSSVFESLNGITAPLIFIDHSGSAKETPIKFVNPSFNVGVECTSIFKFLNTSPVKGSVIVDQPTESGFLASFRSLGVPISDPVNLVTVMENGRLSGFVGISATDTQSNNLRGSLTITEANTTGTVTFGTAEPNGTYFLAVTPMTASGGATAGSTRVRSVSKTGANFVVTIEAAPGAGESVSFDWVLIR